jgi:hypothetical protein
MPSAAKVRRRCAAVSASPVPVALSSSRETSTACRMDPQLHDPSIQFGQIVERAERRVAVRSAGRRRHPGRLLGRGVAEETAGQPDQGRAVVVVEALGIATWSVIRESDARMAVVLA